MKKFLSIILVVLLAITATVALVACDKDADDKWISLSDHLKTGSEDYTALLFEKKTNSITGAENWTGGNSVKIDINSVKNNTLPMNTYSTLAYKLKGIDRNENYSKIKFTIEVEEDADLHLYIGKCDIGIKNLVKGINNIELDYEKGMLLTTSGVTIKFDLISDADIVKWSVNNIKLLPIEE